ncbi:MAG TPA: DegT/DnrJ/EryC1/StrS family aminotransferase [Bryobacterales bacterium]|nr:DegT/DnrJ/EryC1/StrS family aminotransferase [Bryobacterales bacterium]
MARSIPFVNLKPALDSCRQEWQERLTKAINRAWFILGEEVAAFEREFAYFCGSPFAVGVASGTDALEIALRLAGVTAGGAPQEVITSPLTAAFTAHAILAAGATPVFADVLDDTLLLDPRAVEARITPRTAAILPVHLYGQTCDLEALAALAARSGVALIQDASQAHGADYNGHPLSAWSPLIAYSFYPTKNLGCLGDGGALLVGSAEHDRHARLLRDGGRDPKIPGSHVSLMPARNSRLDEVQAALLRVFLRRLTEWNERRRHLATVYDGELFGIPAEWLRPVGRTPNGSHVRHLYVVRVRRREELIRYLAEQGIGAGVHYPVPLHRQPAFETPDSCPVAERAAAEVLSLPMWPFLAEEQARFVAAQIWKFYLG